MATIDPDGPEARALGQQLADEAEAINERAEVWRPRYDASHFGPRSTKVDWVGVELEGGRRWTTPCTIDGVTARAVVDQSPADGSWAAYAVKGDWGTNAVHRLEAADNELAAKASALDAAWAVIEGHALNRDA